MYCYCYTKSYLPKLASFFVAINFVSRNLLSASLNLKGAVKLHDVQQSFENSVPDFDCSKGRPTLRTKIFDAFFTVAAKCVTIYTLINFFQWNFQANWTP